MKEKKKLNIILLSVLGVLVVAIVIVSVMLHHVNKRNRAGFNAQIQEFCVEHNVRISEDGSEYIVNISPDAWQFLSPEFQQQFCYVIYAQVSTALWDNKIKDKPWTPLMWFYVDGVMVASGAAGEIELK